MVPGNLSGCEDACRHVATSSHPPHLFRMSRPVGGGGGGDVSRYVPVNRAWMRASQDGIVAGQRCGMPAARLDCAIRVFPSLDPAVPNGSLIPAAHMPLGTTYIGGGTDGVARHLRLSRARRLPARFATICRVGQTGIPQNLYAAG